MLKINYSFNVCLFYLCVSAIALLLSGCSILKPIEDKCNECNCILNDFDKKTTSLSANQPSKEIQICACKPWNDSGLEVKKGETYRFEIVNSNGNWKDADINATPQSGWLGFWSNFTGYLINDLKRSANANWYALVGSIGKYNDQTFAVFDSDEQKKFSERKMLDKGTLYFYANDMLGKYGNNTGTLMIKITWIASSMSQGVRFD